MKKYYKYYWGVVAMLLSLSAFSQHLSSFSGSGTANGDKNNFNFYNPTLFGSTSSSDGYFSSGHIQMLTDTSAVLDQSIQVYDLDKIPEQTVFYNTPCRFYVKSDSLERLGKLVTGRSYFVTNGRPKGAIQFNRLNMFQYTTNVDTLEFTLKFALVTSTGDTVSSKKNVKFKIIPTLPFESATFGVGGQQGLPNPEGTEFQVQSIDSSEKRFNYRHQVAKKLSFSGVRVVIKNNNDANSLHLLSYTTSRKITNLDTLNIYAETLVIQGRFYFPSTTINIYAKELEFIDAGGISSFINTTPIDETTFTEGENGPKAGDIHLHISNFSSNPAIRFIMNGGSGQKAASGNPEGSGGKGGNLYSTIDVRNYMVSAGGHSPSRKFDGQEGTFILDSSYASWLHPNFLHLVFNYYKEGFYAGLKDPVVKNLKVYSDSIDRYAADSSIFKLEEDNVLQLAQIVDEVNHVFYNISNNLDYYGNPSGWVPMLSFEVAKAAYTSEVDHALKLLFLDKMVQTAISNLQTRQRIFEQLRDEAQRSVEDNQNNFWYIDSVVIPAINRQIDENLQKQNELKDQLAKLNQELNNRAKDKYDDRATWKWIGVGAKLLQAIPSPYTQAAGSALSLGVKFFGSDDNKIGFERGGQMGELIKNTLQPFTSGLMSDSINTLANNIRGGVKTIFKEIPEIEDIDDAIAVKNRAKNLYRENKERYQYIQKNIKEVVNLYNTVTRVDKSEYGAIRGDLVANEPRLAILQEEIQNLIDKQQKLAHDLETSTQEMLNSKNNVYIGLTAIGNFNFQAYDASMSYDHKLSVLTFDMRRKAFERLRKYYYYMLKAYEYRVLESAGDLWGLNLNNVLAKIDQLITVDGKTSLSESDLEALRSLYLEPIHQLADKIYVNYLQTNQVNNHVEAPILLSKDEMRDLNLGKTITINLFEKGLFPAFREDLKIRDLKVSKAVVGYVVKDDNTTYDLLTFTFDYPTYSRVQKKGMIYNFNNYNRLTKNPIYWATDYDVLTGTILPVTPSPASNSILYSLFEGTRGANEVELYVRPAAWGDIKLSMTHTTSHNNIVKLNDLRITVDYDFLRKPGDVVNVELNTNHKWFAPTFEVSSPDKLNRRSGIGNIYRTYFKSSEMVMATTPKKYGRYNFVGWATKNEIPLTNGNGIDISGGNTLKFSLNTDRSFKAIYKFEGAKLNIPDTVYLGDTLRYVLTIKNDGGGSLFWQFDSAANWIKYFVKSYIKDTSIILHFDPNPDANNTRIGALDVSSTETELLHNYIYFVQSKGSLKPNQPPVVNITTPAKDTVYKAPAVILLKAEAKDADTISTVEFYNQGKLLHTDSTSPYNYTLKNAAPGNYFFVAKATDKKGLFALSSNVQVIVNKAPVVNIHTDATVYTAPASITIYARASDSDGTIQYVRFYNGTKLLKTDSTNTGSYTFSWNSVPAGSYSLTVKATDNHGSATTSVAVLVKVLTGNTLEAEEAVLSGVLVASKDTGFTGTGYADYNPGSGNYIEWTVNVAAADAGLYTLDFRYANGKSKDIYLRLEVNGVVTNLSQTFSPTGGWSKWSVSSVAADLIAGINKIRLITPGSNDGPNVDHLKIQPQTLEAENALLHGAVVASVQPGFTGTGYADYINKASDFIEWTVKVEDSGLYSLQFKYANGGPENRPLKLEVNGVVVDTGKAFLRTGDWAVWSISSANANLIAGTNKIRLTTIGSNGPNVDHLRVDKGPCQSGIREAENAALNGAVVANNKSGFTGTGFADYIHASGDYIEWTVNILKEGPFSLKFKYANGGNSDRPLRLELNGVVVPQGLIFPSTGSWTNWSIATATVNLNAGNNKVRLTTTGSNGPNVDNLTFSCAKTIQQVLQRFVSKETVSPPDLLKASISPNPVKGKAKLLISTSSSLPVNVQLFDILGRKYKSFKFLVTGSNNFDLPVNYLSPGVYIVLLNQGNLMTHTRFIVERK